MRRHSKRILLTCGALSLLAAMLVGLAYRRWQSVSYLQQQFARAWEISYNVNGKPRMQPPELQAWAADYFWRKYGSEAYPKNYHELLNARFSSLFVGQINEIDVWYPGGSLGSDLHGALRAFPHLESLWIMDNWGERPVEQWERTAEDLAGLNLKRLALVSVRSLSSRAIATLARSKSLRELQIDSVEINGETMGVFMRWATLQRLILTNCEYNDQALQQLRQQRPALRIDTKSDLWGYCPDVD